MSLIHLVKDDTAPQIKATLTREDTGAVIDLSGATTKMYFRAKGGTSILLTLTAASVGSDAAAGVAIFTFSSGQLNLSAGFYEGEIEVTHSDGRIETIFEVLNFKLRSDF